jgi:hypothetical protein
LPAPNWSQALPRPIIIPEVMQLATLVLYDKHLPAEYRAKFGWRQLAGRGSQDRGRHRKAARTTKTAEANVRLDPEMEFCCLDI